MKRRKFLRRAGNLICIGATAGLYAWRVEPYWLEFIHQDLPINNLPQPLEGKTLLQISDIHVGNRFDYQFIIDSFEEAKAFKPEIVVYTGDYVSWESEEQLTQLQEVMAHAVHGSLGTVAILGNHDYGENWQEPEVADQITEVLGTVGITVLRNQFAEIEGLNIIGIDEWLGTNFDPDQALAGYQPGKANLALCHNPDVCDLDVWGDYQGWILAGHTHGGQCRIPFYGPPVQATKNEAYTEGKFDLGNGRKLYINRALGCSWPVRFGVRPEVTVFHLVRSIE